jgi:L-amino acid N-acyltransferase YncA
VQIREAEPGDIHHLYSWRIDEVSRMMSMDSNPVTLEEHIVWFNRSLLNPNRKIYIGVEEDTRIGVCRFDFSTNGGYAEVSINLNPAARGKGFGMLLLSAAIAEYRDLKCCTLIASIKKENIASIKIFERCSFVLLSESDLFYTYINKGN